MPLRGPPERVVCVEPKKSRWNLDGLDRRETPKKATVLSGTLVFDPAQRPHVLGKESKN